MQAFPVSRFLFPVSPHTFMVHDENYRGLEAESLIDKPG